MDFARGQITRGVTSELLILVSYLPFAFSRIILWIVLVTQLSAVLHAGCVSCHNFRSLRLSCRKWPKSQSVSLRVGGDRGSESTNYSLSFFSSVVWSGGWIKSEARLRNLSQSVWASTRAEMSLALTWSRMLKKIGRWSESSTSETVTSERRSFLWITMSSTSPLFRGV